MPDACAGIEHTDRSYRPQGTPVVSESVPYEHPLPYASGVRYYLEHGDFRSIFELSLASIFIIAGQISNEQCRI